MESSSSSASWTTRYTVDTSIMLRWLYHKWGAPGSNSYLAMKLAVCPWASRSLLANLFHRIVVRIEMGGRNHVKPLSDIEEKQVYKMVARKMLQEATEEGHEGSNPPPEIGAWTWTQKAHRL